MLEDLEDKNEEVGAYIILMDEIIIIDQDQNFDILQIEVLASTRQEIPKIELKSFQKHLRYEFLGEDFTNQVIINAKLYNNETEKLHHVRKRTLRLMVT